MNTPRKEYAAAVGKWTRIRDCSEGSDAVKAKGKEYLPLLDSHKKGGTGIGDTGAAKYAEYSMRAAFYNATGRTIEGLSGAIFQKTPTVKLPKLIEEHADDITMTGVSAELFALRTTREVLTPGRYGVLVEMSADVSADKTGRPYWVGYRAEDVISWRTERRGGDEILTRVVLREDAEEPDPKDPFVQKCIEQYRVLELTERGYTQTVWRRVEDARDEWAPWAPEGQADPVRVIERRGTPLDFIPFVFLGPTSTAPEIEKPPLLDLADMNLSHFRTMADLEHGRHWTALPTPYVCGAMAGGPESGELAIGGGTAWVLEKGATVGMLEFTGQGLGALEKADEQKRRMMATLGARLLEEQPGSAETAAAVGMRHSGEHATLRTVAQAVEQGLTIAMRWHAWWMGVEATPADVDAGLELNKEFFAVKASPDEVRAALFAWQGGGMAFKTFYERLQKGGWARDGVSAEDELKEIDAETPPVPEALAGDPAADPNADPGGPPPPANVGPGGAAPPPKMPPPPPPAVGAK